MKRTYINKNGYLAIMLILVILSACKGQTDEEMTSSDGTALFQISDRLGETSDREISYYTFKDNMLYKTGHGLVSPFRLSVPPNARVFFFSGETEPAGLAAVATGKTTLDEFLAIRTEESEYPVDFYTGSLLRTDNSAYRIPLSIGVAQIDMDATSSDLLRISSIHIENVPASTLLFSQEHPASSTSKVARTYEFTPPAGGKKENIFRIYESNTPVIFSVEGEYDGIPLSFKASLPQVSRNTKYTLKVMNAGTEVTVFFSIDEWTQTDTVNTAAHADEKLLIDMEHSVFPAGTVVSDSRQSLDVPYTGGDITLAFMAESAVDFESVIDELSNLQTSLPEVRREDDRILTKYHIHVKGQGDNTLPYMTTLNVKSVLRQHSTNNISLIVGCPPLYIREVTLGGRTWMNFNARSRTPDDQIYPMKGYDVEGMYKHEWLNTLGGMFQYGRNYIYVPWESGVDNQGNQTVDLPWMEAKNTPCPEGYRIPTATELFQLLGNGSGVPGSWDYNGERITASEVIASNDTVKINGVSGVAKFLKLAGAGGGCMYIPYGGTKSSISPSPEDPKFEQGFRLWCADDERKDGQAMSIYYGNLIQAETPIKSVKLSEISKKSYAYVRCIKDVNSK